MKKILAAGLLSVVALFSCQQAGTKDDGTITVTNEGLTVCDVSRVKDTLEIPLSEWVEELKVVHFEDSDTALFRFQWLSITDEHILIKPYHRADAALLFDYQGKFLCDVGSVGEGPGEYTSLSSHAIDEKNGVIYLANFFRSSKILKYDMRGKFIGEMEADDTLNKPKIKCNPDGTLSVVHLYFHDSGSKYQAAHIGNEGVIDSCPPFEHMTIQFKNPQFMGFDHELWCYNNTEDQKFKLTNCDTLYRYDVKKNALKADFVLANLQRDENTWFIINPLPDKYVTMIMGKGTLVSDMKQRKSYYANLKNDLMGGLPAPFNFTDGYFFAMYEPGRLMTLIEKRLSESGCTEKDKEVLNKLLASLDEEGNNVLFVGKLKK